MSMTEQEAAMEEFIDEVSKEAVENFKDERLVSYFMDNPRLAEPARWALREAEAMLATHPSAAQVFATASIEVAIKGILLKPMIHGFVHSEPAAALLADAVLRQVGVDRFKELLFPILAEHGGIDLSTHTRPAATTTLWNEITNLQKERNAVVHRAQPVDAARAEVAVLVARHLFQDVFPQLVARVGLHLLSTKEVCSKWDPRAAREQRGEPAV